MRLDALNHTIIMTSSFCTAALRCFFASFGTNIPVTALSSSLYAFTYFQAVDFTPRTGTA